MAPAPGMLLSGNWRAVSYWDSKPVTFFTYPSTALWRFRGRSRSGKRHVEELQRRRLKLVKWKRLGGQAFATVIGGSWIRSIPASTPLMGDYLPLQVEEIGLEILDILRYSRKSCS